MYGWRVGYRPGILFSPRADAPRRENLAQKSFGECAPHPPEGALYLAEIFAEFS